MSVVPEMSHGVTKETSAVQGASHSSCCCCDSVGTARSGQR